MICSIYKGKGDRNDLNNWRPITLLNTDYKLFTTIINNRLLSTLKTKININQSGFIKNRFIIENVRIIEEILRLKSNFSLLFLDIAKAFDTVQHKTIFRLLKLLNAPIKFQKLIKNIYKNTQVYIKLNSKLSLPFMIRCGVKQGDPLSPTIFIMVIELLSRTLEKNLKGINLYGTPIKSLLYADDTTVICRDSDINKTKLILYKFKKASGLKVNLVKSGAIYKGVEENEFPPIKEEGFKTLGFYFNQNSVINNISNLFNNIKRLLIIWKSATTNIQQKSMIFNTYALSKIWYNC